MRRAVGAPGSQPPRPLTIPLKENPMAKLAIFVELKFAAGLRDQILPLLSSHRARCLRDEPGTLQFELLIPHEDETKLIVYEVYENDAAFELHRTSPSITQWRAQSAHFAMKGDLTKCALAA